jgi:chemotaxis signal transduction protein
MLIVLKGASSGGFALLAERVSGILSVPKSDLLPVCEEDSFNSCVEATVSAQGEVIYLLSPTRILLEKERDSLAGFQTMAQERLRGWEPEAL